MLDAYTLIGAALAASWADTDTPDDRFSQDEFSLTFAPYAAYALDDVFAIDGSFGYGVGLSDTERTGGVEGDAVNHRYFGSVNGTARKYWGDFGLFGSVGALWTQSFQGAYAETDGTRVGSQTIELGRLSAKVQPSYLIPFDLVTVEPFVSLGYSYDYTLTKITGAANDRDQVDLKLGANIFGDGISGGLEFETGFFRENERRSSVAATVRIQF